jgi:serine protease Do
VNAHGELIGIDTFIISDSGSFAGAGFAIPSQIVKTSAEAIIKDGAVHHGYLGISMNDVTPENSSFFNLPDAMGAIVSQVTLDSPASRAGLQHGDVLRELNGKKIVNGSALQVAVSQTAPGATIDLGVLRNGKQETLKVTVGEYKATKTEEASTSGSGENKGRLGLAVDNLSPDARQQFRSPENVKGAVIETVRPGSPADDAGLAPGNVVLEVNRKPVEDAQNFANQVRSAPDGKDILLLVWANGGASYRVVHPAANGQNGL